MITSSTTLEALDRALPELRLVGEAAANGAAKYGNSALHGNASAVASASEDAVDTLYRMLPREWQERIAMPPPDSDRSRMFARIIGYLKAKHPSLSLDIIEALVGRFPQGPASKYQGRLRTEIERLYRKQSKIQAQREAERAARGNKPVVQLQIGMIGEKLDEAEQYLLRNPTLYQRGDFIVRPAMETIKLPGGRITKRPGVITVMPLLLRELWTHEVDFQQFSAERGEYVSVNCPHEFARHYLERKRGWRLPYLAAISTVPIMRADGSVVQTPGYDPESAVLYDPMGITYPPVPENPTREDALQAVAVLKVPYAEFPYVSDPPVDGVVLFDEDLETPKSASRSVALSLCLTALRRATLPTAPMHAFNASQPGSGKTKSVDIASIIVCGHPVAPFSPGLTEEELEKKLTGDLVSGAQIICLDNCEEPLSGMLLAQCLTSSLVKVRLLRTNDNPVVPCTAVITATGNNLALGGDLPRRSLRGDIETGVEQPELRQFAEDACDIALRLRPELVVAGLTLLRAYHLVRDNKEPLSPVLGSFEEWSRSVRDALIWVGESDPVMTMANIRAADPALGALSTVIAQWELHLGSERYTVTEIIKRACGDDEGGEDKRQGDLRLDAKKRFEGIPDLREVLLAVAGRGGNINGFALGRWLGKVAGRVVGNQRIIKAGTIHGLQHWQLVPVDRAAGAAVAGHFAAVPTDQTDTEE